MADNTRKIRILVAKPGLDGHDRGAKIIARALRDDGFEVIYTGLHQTPEMIVAAAVQEDVDAIGMSIMSGAHMTLFPAVIDLLKSQGVTDISIFGGGIIPDADIPELKKLGVAEIFTPGATMASVTEWLERALDEREPGPERPAERRPGPERPAERRPGPERPAERRPGPERPAG